MKRVRIPSPPDGLPVDAIVRHRAARKRAHRDPLVPSGVKRVALIAAPEKTAQENYRGSMSKFYRRKQPEKTASIGELKAAVARYVAKGGPVRVAPTERAHNAGRFASAIGNSAGNRRGVRNSE